MILGGVKKITYLRLGFVLYMFGLGGSQARGRFGLLTGSVRPLKGGLMVIVPTIWECVFEFLSTLTTPNNLARSYKR